jgi:hypothetical protein
MRCTLSTSDATSDVICESLGVRGSCPDWPRHLSSTIGASRDAFSNSMSLDEPSYFIIVDGNGVNVDFHIVRGRNNELHKAIWKVNELFMCCGLSLNESDISGLYLASMLEVQEQENPLRYIDVAQKATTDATGVDIGSLGD